MDSTLYFDINLCYICIGRKYLRRWLQRLPSLHGYHSHQKAVRGDHSTSTRASFPLPWASGSAAHQTCPESGARGPAVVPRTGLWVMVARAAELGSSGVCFSMGLKQLLVLGWGLCRCQGPEQGKVTASVLCSSLASLSSSCRSKPRSPAVLCSMCVYLFTRGEKEMRKKERRRAGKSHS